MNAENLYAVIQMLVVEKSSKSLSGDIYRCSRCFLYSFSFKLNTQLTFAKKVDLDKLFFFIVMVVPNLF